MLADRQTDRHTRHNTPLSYWDTEVDGVYTVELGSARQEGLFGEHDAVGDRSEQFAESTSSHC